ncbi:Uncharacterised protein [Klebsiella quasipneumoniae]|nr:Uncharacterised protein [Klebsiella quasipneumoniae]
MFINKKLFQSGFKEMVQFIKGNSSTLVVI